MRHLDNLDDTLVKHPWWVLVFGFVVSLATAVLSLVLLLSRGVSTVVSIKLSIVHFGFVLYLYVLIFLLIKSMRTVEASGEKISSMIRSLFKKIRDLIR